PSVSRRKSDQRRRLCSRRTYPCCLRRITLPRFSFRVAVGRISTEATMSDYDTLLSDASQLPLDARIQLIEALWDTVPEDALPPLSDEWLAEINQRSAEYDAGSV